MRLTKEEEMLEPHMRMGDNHHTQQRHRFTVLVFGVASHKREHLLKKPFMDVI